MALRSWLFVPGDSEKKLSKAAETGADAIILDLEDSVTPANKARARELTLGWLESSRNATNDAARQGRWVRINALDSGIWHDDLSAVMPGAPDGIMLPKSAGPESVQQLSDVLSELEQRHGIASGATKILPLVSETAAAAITIPAYARFSQPRLAGLTWGAEDLSAAIGATRTEAVSRARRRMKSTMAASSITGWVLGMTIMVVTPPMNRMARVNPVNQSAWV